MFDEAMGGDAVARLRREKTIAVHYFVTKPRILTAKNELSMRPIGRGSVSFLAGASRCRSRVHRVRPFSVLPRRSESNV